MARVPGHQGGVEPTIDELIERSSFSTAAAKQLRSRTPAEILQHVDDRVALVDGLQRMVRRSVASLDLPLSRDDRSVVAAATFIRLLAALHTVREPERLPGWLATTARLEALRLVLGRGPVPLSADRALTPSERRVTELAASGLSNSEIAKALFVSLNTVEAHLSSVYRKLGVSSRAQMLDLHGGGRR